MGWLCLLPTSPKKGKGVKLTVSVCASGPLAAVEPLVADGEREGVRSLYKPKTYGAFKNATFTANS